MKLNDEQINQILTNGAYNGLFAKQRMSTAFFEEPSPLGSVVVFESPLTIGPVHFEQSLVICGELPNIDIFGGVCFQRLYSAQLGSVLSNLLNLPCYINQNCLFVNDKQTSITTVNQYKTSVIFHVFLPIVVSKDGDHGLHEIKLNTDQKEEFKDHCIACFQQLTKSLFLETQRDNI